LIDNNSKIIAVIPARGGSKGIPRKNLIMLGDHPLIAYSIVAALKSKAISHVIVSTDDKEIADISQQYGAQVPFMRPQSLAKDETVDYPVIEHALNWVIKNLTSDIAGVVQLRPTSPFRPKNLIDQSIELFVSDQSVDCIRGVTMATQTPYKMWKINNDYLSPIINLDVNEPYNLPRQLLPDIYWQTGHIDIIRSSTILEKKTLTGDRIKPIIIQNKYCIDIDTLEDLELARIWISNKDLDINQPE